MIEHDTGIVLAADPGDSIGLCEFDVYGDVQRRWTTDLDGLFQYLSETNGKIRTIVVEDYREGFAKGQRRTHKGNRFLATQVIGALKYHAYRVGAEFELVTNQAKDVGSLYTGVKQPTNHKESHDIDALNLGTWWFVDQKIIDPASLRDLLGDL